MTNGTSTTRKTRVSTVNGKGQKESVVVPPFQIAKLISTIVNGTVTSQ